MGFFKKLIKTGIGLAGKHLMNTANTITGGLAGKLTNTVIEGVNKHSGIIGKVAQGIGKKLFSEETRNKISNFADKALKYIPKGNVRTALEKVNNAAQGRTENNNAKLKTDNINTENSKQMKSDRAILRNKYVMQEG